MTKADVTTVRSQLPVADQRCVARSATAADWPRIWQLLEPIIRAGQWLPFPPDWSEEEARLFWFAAGNDPIVGERHDRLIWAYYICPIFIGGGSHIANAAYAVDQAFVGQGYGEEMGQHSMQHARDAGYLAMEYKIVLSNNTAAIGLYTKLGFAIVGRVPDGYRHPHLGFIDTLMMHRRL